MNRPNDSRLIDAANTELMHAVEEVQPAFVAGNVERWIERMEEMREKYPWHVLPYNAIGDAYTCAGKFDLAEQYLNQALAVALEDQKSKVYRLFGQLYTEKWDLDRAFEYFEKALAVSKDDWHIYYSLARACMRRGDLDKALENLRTSYNLAPEGSRPTVTEILTDLEG